MAMWMRPKILGFNPSERWGHSACYSNGAVYIFGGCCGGRHFSDVLELDLDTLGWTKLVTVGCGPGPRDSHSAVMVGHKMIVFGGTDGCKKVNDLYMLDLRSKEWSRPEQRGSPPSPRESHSAALVGDGKLVIFGGCGEGDGNYLNDLHVLDINTAEWASPEVKGRMPVPRDSHSATTIGRRLFVYGGDSGDRYHGDVDVFDMDTQTWSRLPIQGPSPSVRAGHAALSMGTKVFVIGGVGDRHYYSDVWVLDVSACLWTQIHVFGLQPRGRFSHTAILSNSGIVVYGGCGEDERPLNELLLLQLGAEHLSGGREAITFCKIFGSHLNQGTAAISMEAENHFLLQQPRRGGQKKAPCISSEMQYPKRRRTRHSKSWATESEPEEHSVSLSQSSSPSQSDQEQSLPDFHGLALFKQQPQNPSRCEPNITATDKTAPRSIARRALHGFHGPMKRPKSENWVHVPPVPPVPHACRQEGPSPEEEPSDAIPNIIGAEVRGKVDGIFDSGYLMTAAVNGRIFRGVLFTPVIPSSHVNNADAEEQKFVEASVPESGHGCQQAPGVREEAGSLSGEAAERSSEMQSVVLTLGGPCGVSGRRRNLG